MKMLFGKPRLRREPKPDAPPQPPVPPPGPTPPGYVRCPLCQQFAGEAELVCPQCGFPFTCDLTPVDTLPRRAVQASWRIALAIASFIFAVTSGVFYRSGSQEYQGFTQDVVTRLSPASVAGEVAVEGPPAFVFRTQLALALLKQRAPDTYWRIEDSAAGIEFLAASYLETDAGKKAPLDNIGALAEPATGRIMVMATTAFPSGTGELWDRDVFTYAGVLVHELRHLELHAMGGAPGGWQEEALCEQAAYETLSHMQAPPGLLARYESYLADPQARRYQGWYNWYKNWE
jgi:hypothetical protein